VLQGCHDQKARLEEPNLLERHLYFTKALCSVRRAADTSLQSMRVACPITMQETANQQPIPLTCAV
jgi:hypothetical protein